jgi:hypothetical protein
MLHPDLSGALFFYFLRWTLPWEKIGKKAGTEGGIGAQIKKR